MFRQSLLRYRTAMGLQSGRSYNRVFRPSKAWLALFTLLALASSPASAEGFSAGQKAEIEAIIKNYLLQKPEILREAIGVLEAREAAALAKEREKIVGESSSVLFRPASQGVIGNPNGKISIVEFFDYNCGYCKRALGDLARLMKENPDLRVVLRDLPILSPASAQAALVANAFLRQFQGEKFWEFHQKLLSLRGQIGKPEALAVAKELGADMDKLEKDAADAAITQGIQESEKIAKALQINGTPSYVIGEDVVIGAVGYEDLQAKVANMKKCGKAVC